jgi:hypothetical protein
VLNGPVVIATLDKEASQLQCRKTEGHGRALSRPARLHLYVTRRACHGAQGEDVELAVDDAANIRDETDEKETSTFVTTRLLGLLIIIVDHRTSMAFHPRGEGQESNRQE